jgi:hypothetical protein
MLDKLASPFYLDKHMNEEIVPLQVTVTTITSGASLNEVVRRAQLIDETYRKIMKKDVHYGVIPGTTGKPSLLLPGAQKLCSVFNLGCPDPKIERIELPDGHREYIVKVDIVHYPTGKLIGSGVGSCSTMEKKYRYRKGEENPDIADVWNTCLKMGKKRALVDAVLTATGASDIFTQDVEDMGDLIKDEHETARPAAKPSAGRQYELKEATVWHAAVKDVEEKKGKDGTIYFQVELDDGRKLFTSSGDLAKEAAETEGAVHLEVRPGRRADSWVLAKILEEPVEA